MSEGSNVVALRPKVLSPATLRGAAPPERSWIVPDWIPTGVVTGLYGDGGLGKSLLAQQLQSCTALGRPWLGMAVQRVASLGVYCEDSHDELWRRQARINAALGCDCEDLSSAHWMPRFGEDNVMMTFASNGVGELTAFHNQVVEAAQDCRARLVIVDTASDVFAGSENDRNQVRQFVQRALGKLAVKINGAVVLCAHPSRASMNSGSGDSGSTGWSNALRSRMYLKVPGDVEGEIDTDARILERKKANYASRHDVLSLRWKDGVIVRDWGNAPEGCSDKQPVTEVFICLLDERNAADRPVSENSRAPNYAPKVFSELPADRRAGYTARQFKGAMEALFETKEIAVAQYGRKSDMRKKIVRQAELAMAA